MYRSVRMHTAGFILFSGEGADSGANHSLKLAKQLQKETRKRLMAIDNTLPLLLAVY